MNTQTGAVRAGLALCVVALTGCGASDLAASAGLGEPERSAEKLCAVYWSEKKAYLADGEAAAEAVDEAGGQDPLLGALVGIGSGLSMMGDVVIMFDKFDAVAPPEIRPDVAAIRDVLQKSIDDAGDAASDPLRGLLSGLMSGLTTSGSWTRFNDYVVKECGEDVK